MFFKYLNSKHPIIKFTMEKETIKFSPFSDVPFKNKRRTFTTSVYRKKVSIELFMKYSSFTPFSYKISLKNCLTHRAFKIYSSYLIFHDKINKMKNILQKDMHPIFVIDDQIKSFLEMQYTTINNENTINNNKKVHFKLLYIGTFSNATKIKLKQKCDKDCKNTNIVVSFSPSKIEGFFSCKDWKLYQELLSSLHVSWIGMILTVEGHN